MSKSLHTKNSRRSRQKRKARPTKKTIRPKKVTKPLPKTIDELGTVATVNEVAAILRVSRQQVSNLVDEGVLDAIDIARAGSSRRCLRIETPSLRKFINSPKRKAGFA
jgi:helix-turn-helix protein